MRPIPVPERWVPPGCERKVLFPPDGDPTSEEIRPIEVVIDPESGHFHSFWISEVDDDIQLGPKVVVVTTEGVPPALALAIVEPAST